MFRPFVDLILYGHFWIALAAWLMQVQTQFLLFGQWRWSAFDGFVAAGTLVIYALHRLVAMHLQREPVYAGRFQVMRTYQSHILIYAIVAALASAWFFWQLTLKVQLSLLAPCLVALAYVLPVFRGKRLRDFPYLKIFLIALSWAWITVFGPLLQWGGTMNQAVLWLFVERAAFVFAITIPFDIRDLMLDLEREVPTLPGRLGMERAKQIAYVALLGMLFAVSWNYWQGFYGTLTVLALVFSALSSGLLVYYSSIQRHDYYFTGALDGTMILQALVVVWVLIL